MKKTKSYNLDGKDVSLSKENIILRTRSLDENAHKRKHCFNRQKFRPFLGFFYSIMASFCIVLSSVIVKKLTYISPGQLSLVRNMGTFIGNLPIAVFSTKNILGPKKYKLTLSMRSFLGATALYLNLMAFRYLPIAEASIIMSTLPAFVTVAARFYLKESCGVVQTIAVLLTVVGMLLSIRLPELLKNNTTELEGMEHVSGLLCAFGCVIVLTSVFILMRTMQNVHFSVIQLYAGILGTLENTILTAIFSFFSIPLCNNGWDSVQIMLVGILGFFGSTCLTLAILNESAGVVSVIKSCSDIMISMAFQIVFFDLNPDAYNIIGAVLVIGSVTIISMRKVLLTLPEESEKRKKLRYLLL